MVSEEDVTRVWAEVIGIDVAEVDAETPFFELGGNSFMMIKLVAELNALPGVDTTIVELLEYTTIEELVAHVNAQAAGR